MSLRDIVTPHPRVLFVGINPSIRSGQVGHHFASPGNPFWRLLYEAKLIPIPLTCEQDHQLTEFGMAMTNLCPRATRSAAELRREEIEAGKLALARKIRRVRPKVAAFVGLSIYRDFFGNAGSAGAGAKDETISSARVFVLPNPSGLNASFPGFRDKLVWFEKLRQYIDSAPLPNRRQMESVEKFATKRMVAERIGDSDFADLCRMNSDPQVAATLGGVRSESQTRGFVQDSIEHWQQHGYGVWVFRNREDGSFIGRAGLRHVVVQAAPEIELAYAVMPDFWREGIATEMSLAILEIAAMLRVHDVVAFTLPTNLGSRGVVEKVGFTYEREITWANLSHVLYRKRL